MTMKKTKVVFLTNYWKGCGGGVDKTVIKIAHYFSRHQQNDVKVIYRIGKDEQNYGLNNNKIAFAFKAYNILRKEQPNVMHVQGGWFTLLPAILFKYFNHVPILYLFHTSFTSSIPWYKRMAYNFLLNRCDVICFVSQYHLNNIKNVGKIKFKVKTAVIVSGADKEEVTEQEIIQFKKEFNLSNANPIVLGLGLTFLKNKAEGAKLLITAISKLKAIYPGIRLVLTRDGPHLEELRSYVKKVGLTDYVVFTGTIPNSWVALHSCDIYAQITIGESLGLGALEAMSIGKPVIVSSIGGMKDVITDGYNGIIVDLEVEQIVNAIRKIKENKQLFDSISRNGILTIENNYTWKRVADKYLNLINEITMNEGGE
ncbi:MAG: glycosyltransferase family 4 protein [Euryarchaeota archaeon]|nr:glycosyltransferase family 4 protein [Euryarchaeota archaeon]